MNKTNLPLASLCVFWAYFIVSGFLCPDYYYLHKTKSRHHHCFRQEIRTCRLEGGLRPENPSYRRFFRPEVKLYDLRTLQNVRSLNIPAHFPENEHFLTPCPKSLHTVGMKQLSPGKVVIPPCPKTRMEASSVLQRWYSDLNAAAS